MSVGQTRTAPKRSSRLATLAKATVALLFTVALLEGGLRVAGVRTLAARQTPPRDPADLHELEFIAEAQRRGWIPWPKTRTRVDPFPEHPRGYLEMVRNGESCRADEPTPLDKPPGTRRVLTLGDSHTEGTGFNDESLTSCLARETAGEPDGRRIDGVNAGFGGASPYQQLWAYEQVYRRFHPDEVVVVFYAGNDLLELLREDDRVHLERRDGGFVHAERAAAPDVTRTTHWRWERFRQFFRDHSATYAALTDVPALRRAVRSTVRDAYRERLEAAMERHPAPVWQGLNQAYLFRHQPERFDDAAERLRFVLNRFQELTREDGAELTLVILPTLRLIQPEVDEQGLRESIKTLELAANDSEADERACDLADRLADELGIRRLDLRAPFRAAVAEDSGLKLYFQADHHVTPRAQEVIAGRLLALWSRTESP